MDQVLELKHVCYSYHTLDGETPALSDISFAVEKGEFIAVVGPSGCGKTTLLSLIAGPAYAGKRPDPHQWKRGDGKHHQCRLHAAARRAV